MNRDVLRIKNLNWGFNGRNIFNSVNVRIPAGTFTGIIGPNGAGKTTLLKLILKLLPPDRKSIFLDNKDITLFSRKDMARKMSYVPQTPGVDFGFTVKHMVAMGRNPHLRSFSSETSEDRAIVTDALKDTQIEYLSSKDISKISGGELQRVIIARALAQKPAVLALDEPTNHLDLNHQMKILSLVRDLSDVKGITVIAVLHDFNHALEYCDNLILMNGGAVVASGIPENVITPENMHTVYHLEIAMEKNPFTGKPYMIVRS